MQAGNVEWCGKKADPQLAAAFEQPAVAFMAQRQFAHHFKLAIVIPGCLALIFGLWGVNADNFLGDKRLKLNEVRAGIRRAVYHLHRPVFVAVMIYAGFGDDLNVHFRPR